MNGRRLRAVVRKEWQEARRNRGVAWTFVLLAAVFTVMPLALAFGMPAALHQQITGDPHGAALLAELARQHPGLLALPMRARLQALVLRQMLPLFLVLPLVGAMSVATYSVVGERAGRSLEPLLATPLTAGELLLGKSLAAALPAVAGAWICFAVFAAATLGLGGTGVAGAVIDAAGWATLLLVGPLLALLGIGGGVAVSSRAKDPRGAQQIGGLLVLPVVALVVAQTAGVFLLGLRYVVVGAVVLAFLDAALLAWASRRFDRERIFTGSG